MRDPELPIDGEAMQRRILDARQAWPTKTRDNPSGCPHRARAAHLRSLIDTFGELSKVAVETVEDIERECDEQCLHE